MLSSRQLETYRRPDLHLHGGTVIVAADSVTSLSFVLDKHMTTESYVNSICAKCHFHLTRISSVRMYLAVHACRSAVVSLVVSTLDYCNALLARQQRSQIAWVSASAKLGGTSGDVAFWGTATSHLCWLICTGCLCRTVSTLSWRCITTHPMDLRPSTLWTYCGWSRGFFADVNCMTISTFLTQTGQGHWVTRLCVLSTPSVECSTTQPV